MSLNNSFHTSHFHAYHLYVSVATVYFKFMSFLVENVPLGSFSSRDSDIGWVQEGSHLRPVVISPVIRDQCKTLLSESFTRKLFLIAINFQFIDADKIINKKDEHDIKIEEEVTKIQSESTVMVAAKEAMVNHSTGFWQKSKWAKRLSNKVVRFRNILMENKVFVVTNTIYSLMVL